MGQCRQDGRAIIKQVVGTIDGKMDNVRKQIKA
jgi:hypothetical protein